MNESDKHAEPTAGTLAQQSFARFIEALRHITRFMTDPLLEHPLEAAVQRIEANPAFTQYRLLTRLLAAMPGQQGEFRIEEASAFDRDTLAVILSLIHIHNAGTAPAADWERAINRAVSAQMAFNA